MTGDDEIGLVEECVNLFEVKEGEDGSLDIRIVVPARFAELWLFKLDSLRTDVVEIRDFEPPGDVEQARRP